MTLWILDTDHVSFLLRGNRDVSMRAVQKHPNVVTTIITVQELYNGWVGKINKNIEPDSLVDLYSRLSETVEFIKLFPVLKFDERAKDRYILLRQQNNMLGKKRLEKDLRIASIALSFEGTVVTRNAKDFGLIPGLQFESWI